MTVFGDEEDHILLNPKIIKVNNVQFIDNGSFAPVQEYSMAEYDEPHPAYTDDWADEPMWCVFKKIQEFGQLWMHPDAEFWLNTCFLSQLVLSICGLHANF